MLNRISWNRTFDIYTVYLYETELFEIELFICLRMDLALNKLQSLIYYKTQTNKQTNKDLVILWGALFILEVISLKGISSLWIIIIVYKFSSDQMHSIFRKSS